MTKHLFNKMQALLAGLGICLLASCGLYDIDVDELNEVATDFSLGRDTVYVMQGERFVFNPVFVPDTLSNVQVFYQSTDDGVALMVGDTVVAQTEGWATIKAISVSSRLTDSCRVCVLPLWQPTLEYYPYETVFYARVTVKGRPLDEDMLIAAFCGEELRGIGQLYEQKGVRCLRLRVGAEALDVAEDPDDPEGPYVVYRERIEFRCYDRRTHNLYTSPTHVSFDGETHGTPSHLFELNL
jgi:hypothetical protein